MDDIAWQKLEKDDFSATIGDIAEYETNRHIWYIYLPYLAVRYAKHIQNRCEESLSLCFLTFEETIRLNE